MKTIFLTIIAIFLFSVIALAQDENYDEPQTIFSGGTRITGWFVDLNNSYSTIYGKYAYLPGFAAGVVMDNNFRAGLAVKSLSWYESNLRFDNLFDEPAYLNGGYAGLFLEAAPYSDKLVHITIPVILGGGGAVYLSREQNMEWDKNEWDWNYNHRELSSSPFFVIEPGVNVELNITGFMKLYAGYSYRLGE